MEGKCAKDCLNEKACGMVGCIYKHHLVDENNVWLFEIHGKPTIKQCLDAFETLQPPKVSNNQKQAYMVKASRKSLLRKGVISSKPTSEKSGRARPRKIVKEQDRLIRGKQQRVCKFVGVLKVRIGKGLEAGEPVYYEEVEEIYVFKKGESFHKRTIHDRIDFCGTYPEPEPVKNDVQDAEGLSVMSIEEFKQWYRQQPQMNFHEQ